MARFKTINDMEERGMKGVFNGYSSSGRPKYYKFKTSVIERQKKCLQEDICIDANNLKRIVATESTLIEDLKDASTRYSRLLKIL